MARISVLLFTALLTAAAGVAHAQTDYPSRPVKLVVPFAAGGPTDVVARILAEMLTARWGGQSIVIENRPGAGTIVATAAVANAPKDGYTFLIATNSLLINPAIGQKLPYDTLKDLAAVTMIATQPVALVANKDLCAEHDSGAGRARQEKRRADQFHVARTARRRASRRRDVAAARRDQDAAHQLQRQRAGAGRPDRRAGADHVRHLALGEALRRYRSAQVDRGRQRGAARAMRRTPPRSPRPIRALR